MTCDRGRREACCDVGAAGPVGRAATAGATVIVDCLGQPCPVPVIELAKALLAIEVGAVVDVLSDDPAARLDIPAWCRMRTQEYVGEQLRDVGSAYRVRRLS